MSTYITVRQTERFHQTSIDELLFGDIDVYAPQQKHAWRSNPTGTRTFIVRRTPVEWIQKANIPQLVRYLEKFNEVNAHLFEADRASLYRHYEIPKKSGKGMRKIDEPCPELMAALRALKGLFEQKFGALYHTAAYAYIPGRCTVDAVKKHQSNASRWFLKTDFSDFFPATTLEFVMQQFSMLFPFSEVVKTPHGKAQLEKALSLCFLRGGLPQGTPISPLITNLMMIPIDHALANSLRDFDKHNFVYTRYADDIHISCKYDFSYKVVVRHIDETLAAFNAPFKIKPEKTHYGNNSGKNYMLGLLLNKENRITLGHQRKREIRSWIFNYLKDREHNIPTPLEELYVLRGNMSYAKMVEPDWYKAILAYFKKEFSVDVEEIIGADIAA